MNDRLFCYYGDDFTGSTDALEALAANGVASVLFLDPPDAARLAEFPSAQAIGVAGESRSRGPAWISQNLPPVLLSLKSYRAPICQYKVCSTFDSSPQFGSIGRALEIGQEIFAPRYVPIVVTAPHLGRYVLFGNLFAVGGGAVHRIDRHPTMRRHPVTPMEESDLRLHLAHQTDRRIALLDILALHGGSAAEQLDRILEQHPDAILFDGLDERSQLETGRLLWEHRPAGQTFAIGSSGLTHALIRYWRHSGIIAAEFTPDPPASAERLIVMSGSCSPVTERQIRWAMGNGFEALRIDPESPATESLLRQGLAALANGRCLVLYSALGPGDCRGPLRGDGLGHYMGTLLRELMLRSGARRAVVAGGDTSTHAVRQLGIHALTFAALTTPGAPLCRGHSADPQVDGIELVLKGGQVGPENFFEIVLRGK